MTYVATPLHLDADQTIPSTFHVRVWVLNKLIGRRLGGYSYTLISLSVLSGLAGMSYVYCHSLSEVCRYFALDDIVFLNWLNSCPMPSLSSRSSLLVYTSTTSSATRSCASEQICLFIQIWLQTIITYPSDISRSEEPPAARLASLMFSTMDVEWTEVMVCRDPLWFQISETWLVSFLDLVAYLIEISEGLRGKF